jgi:hypothetical protein
MKTERHRDRGSSRQDGFQSEQEVAVNQTKPVSKMFLTLLLAWVCLASCGLQQDISFDEPEAVPPPEGPSVRVVWEQNEPDGVPVFLHTLDKVVVEEGAVWRLWDIVLGAGLEEEEILAMRFDFEGSDGFRPSSKPACPPRQGEDLALMYLDPEELDILWDDSLGLSNCYQVKELAKILGERGS